MARKQKLIGGVAATLLLMATSAVARRGTEKSWKMIAGTNPPTDDSNREVDLKEAASWALVSGAAVGLARLLVRRGVIFRGVPRV